MRTNVRHEQLNSNSEAGKIFLRSVRVRAFESKIRATSDKEGIQETFNVNR